MLESSFEEGKMNGEMNDPCGMEDWMELFIRLLFFLSLRVSGLLYVK